MTKIIVKIYLLCILSLSFTMNLSAQVTIGSAEKPAAGAILDLKQDGGTTKGLGLPRVKLKSYTIPQGETSLAVTITGAEGDWGKDEHVGLVVYSVGGNPCDSRDPLDGAYVWTGEEWQALRSTKSPVVGTFKDTRDGAVYHYREFGEAGTWMLENLRYVPNEADGYVGYELGTSDGALDGKFYSYPNGEDPEAPNTKWRPEYGLLYTYSAATAGAQDGKLEDGVTRNQGEGLPEKDVQNLKADGTPGGEPNLSIQGLCPGGWHIANDYEWNRLEKEIYENAPKYSKYTTTNGFPFSPNAWKEENNWIEANPRGAEDDSPGHGIAMFSQCLPLGHGMGEEKSSGMSNTPNQGGFNVMLVGGAEGQEYGAAAILLTSSLGVEVEPDPEEDPNLEEDYVWVRIIREDMQMQQVYRKPIPASDAGRTQMLSVRCVKDR